MFGNEYIIIHLDFLALFFLYSLRYHLYKFCLYFSCTDIWSWLPWRRHSPIAIFSPIKKFLLLPRLSVDQYNILYLRSSQNNYLLTWLSDQRHEPLVTPQYFSILVPHKHTHKHHHHPPRFFIWTAIHALKRNQTVENNVSSTKVAAAGDFILFTVEFGTMLVFEKCHKILVCWKYSQYCCLAGL